MVKDWFKIPEINKLIDELWKKYPNGFVANVSKGQFQTEEQVLQGIWQNMLPRLR
jgi:hypothetical protein